LYSIFSLHTYSIFTAAKKRGKNAQESDADGFVNLLRKIFWGINLDGLFDVSQRAAEESEQCDNRLKKSYFEAEMGNLFRRQSLPDAGGVLNGQLTLEGTKFVKLL
jgi:hypothetical protein